LSLPQKNPARAGPGGVWLKKNATDQTFLFNPSQPNLFKQRKLPGLDGVTPIPGKTKNRTVRASIHNAAYLIAEKP
jgi:hypothetical protein